MEASISEIFAIKNCYFWALFGERSEKLSAKTACDVNVGQVKKSRKFSLRGTEIMMVYAGINLERTSSLSSKVITFLLFNFLEEYIIAQRT